MSHVARTTLGLGLVSTQDADLAWERGVEAGEAPLVSTEIAQPVTPRPLIGKRRELVETPENTDTS